MSSSLLMVNWRAWPMLLRTTKSLRPAFSAMRPSDTRRSSMSRTWISVRTCQASTGSIPSGRRAAVHQAL